MSSLRNVHFTEIKVLHVKHKNILKWTNKLSMASQDNKSLHVTESRMKIKLANMQTKQLYYWSIIHTPVHAGMNTNGPVLYTTKGFQYTLLWKMH